MIIFKLSTIVKSSSNISYIIPILQFFMIQNFSFSSGHLISSPVIDDKIIFFFTS